MKTDFAAIPVFVAVIECGSFSAAATRLNMTKSAVSKRISVLEDSLGVRLFHRTTRKLSLTEAGEKFSDSARTALLIAEEGFATLSEYQGTPKGTVKINAPMSFSRLHITPYIPEFLTQYPELNVVLNMDDNIVSMTKGGFDLGIRIGALQDSSLIARKILDCPSVLCAAPRYLEQYGVPLTPAELTSHNCIYYSLFQAGTEWTFYRQGETHKVTPKGNFVVNNSEAIAEVLTQGLGIGQMPLFIVADAVHSGALTVLLTDYQLPEHAIYAIYPERKHLPEKVKVFIEFISKKLRAKWSPLPPQ
ncbi:LysR family transcriptional regulator [Thaumasiovibrio subtropicus]|uniref:LysR family transcriptional regulator n=1 Tax=Thaumasiovibrio subtropicus TaxID=1891207 RepID=UPI000B353EA8|nr:LysR family transcriptional regulator [Thaumasiovibrio subtropicus]